MHPHGLISGCLCQVTAFKSQFAFLETLYLILVPSLTRSGKHSAGVWFLRASIKGFYLSGLVVEMYQHKQINSDDMKCSCVI